MEKQHDDSRIVKKLVVKIGVVERAINNIGRAVEPMTSSANSQLNKLLQIDSNLYSQLNHSHQCKRNLTNVSLSLAI